MSTQDSDPFFIASQNYEPAYLALYQSGELHRRAKAALDRLENCLVCPRNCGVNRLANKTAACKSGRYAVIGSYFPHLGEEDCLRGWRGSGTIFFSWCNLRCVFCCHPDTLIPTDQGLLRIADIFERGQGEAELHNGHVRFMNGQVRAVTRHGTFAPVAKAFRRPYTGDMAVLEPSNYPPLVLTPNHEVFAIYRKEPLCVVKMQAENLTEDHFLIVPKRAPAGMRIALNTEFPRISPNNGQRHTHQNETADNFLVPIQKIERVPYDGPVYNLEMDDIDHSYLAPFVAVSNCQNFDISQDGDGYETSPERLAVMMLELQAAGCHNINFVTPEHVVPQILEALPMAVENGLRLPLVYNTSAYDSMDSLHLLEGVVDIYMPDFKFWDSALALRYLKARDYPEAARQAIREMYRQVGDLKFDEHGLAKRGLLVRHLVMPGQVAGTAAIMRFLAEEISPHTYVNIMEQYRPAGKVSAEKYEEINRKVTKPEYQEAVRLAHATGLHRLDERQPPMMLRRQSM